MNPFNCWPVPQLWPLNPWDFGRWGWVPWEVSRERVMCCKAERREPLHLVCRVTTKPHDGWICYFPITWPCVPWLNLCEHWAPLLPLSRIPLQPILLSQTGNWVPHQPRVVGSEKRWNGCEWGTWVFQRRKHFQPLWYFQHFLYLKFILEIVVIVLTI